MKIHALAIAVSMLISLGPGCASAEKAPDPCQQGESYDAKICAEKLANDAERAERQKRRRERTRFPSGNSGRRPSSY